MGKNTQQKNSGIYLREFSSGGVVYQKVGNKVLWLIRSTNPSKLYPNKYWMLPKGWIDNDAPDVPGPMASGRVKADEESLQKSALREVAEEGGVEAKIIDKLETIKYSYTDPNRGKILKFVTFFLMEFQHDLSEGHDNETSEVKWLDFGEAYKELSFSFEKQILKKASGLV